MHYRDPLSVPMSGLRRELDQLFSDAFGSGEGGSRETRGGGSGSGGGSRGGGSGLVRGWTPAVEIREDEDELVFEFDLPGVRSEDIDVTHDRGVLVVRGHRHAQRSEGPGRIHVTERAYGEFGRFFQLPQTVNEEQIEASFEDGVLTVRVPKSEIARPRKIEIRSGGGGGGEGGGAARQSAEVRGGSGRGGAIGGGGGGSASRGAGGSGGGQPSGGGGTQRRGSGGGGAAGASGGGSGGGGATGAREPGGREPGGGDGR